MELSLPPNVADIRRWVRMAQPFCLVEKNAAQTITNSTVTDVTWQVDRHDDWGMHDTSSNTEQITIPVSGRYLVHCVASWAPRATGERQLYLEEIGELNKIFSYDLVPGASASLQTRHSVTAVLQLSAGVYVKAVCRVTGGDLDLEANTTIAQFLAIRIG